MSDFKAKMHQIRFRLGELTALPSTTRGLLLRGEGRKGKGTGREGRDQEKGKGREGEKGREGGKDGDEWGEV